MCVYTQVHTRTIPSVSKKKLTLLNILPYKKCETFSGNFHVWMAEGLIYHMTPKKMEIVHAWVSTGHFCKGYEIRLCKNWLSILAEREVPQHRNC